MIFADEFLNPQIKLLAVAIPTMITWFVVTLVTPPEPEALLEKFYRQTRPGGPGWQPVAKKCPEVVPDEDFGLSIMGSLIASGIVYCLLYAIGKFIFGEYGPATAGLALGGLCLFVTLLIVKRLGSGEDP